MLNDLRYAVRTLLHAPAFAAIAVITLALGIGANTAIFSVVNAVLLRPLPFRDADAIVRVWTKTRDEVRSNHSPGDFIDLRRENRSLAAIAGYRTTMFAVAPSDGGDGKQLPGVYTTVEMFDVLGVDAVRGRVFTAARDATPGEPVVVLSEPAAEAVFSGADPVGQRVRVDGQPYTVLGVVARHAEWPADNQVWVLSPKPVPPSPLDVQGPEADREVRYFEAIARLKPGVTVARAQDDLSRVASIIQQQHPQSAGGRTIAIGPLREEIVGDVRTGLVVLQAAVGLVLLIACANVSGLLIARATGRRRELTVRAALGAGRRRLIRQLLTESLVLGVVGGIAGLLLGAWLTVLLVRVLPSSVPRTEEISLDMTVTAFTVVAALVTAMIFGVIPALQASRADVSTALKQAGDRGSSGRARLRAALVAGEVALTLVLLVGAGLLLNSFLRLQRVDSGLQAEGVSMMGLILQQSRYPTAAAQMEVFRRIVENLSRRGEFRAVGIGFPGPLKGDNASGSFFIEGRPSATRADRPFANLAAVSGGYFAALGVPLLSGRTFAESDRDGSPGVVIVSAALARKYWPGETAVGKHVRFDDDEKEPWMTVVGVAGDVRQLGLAQAPPPILYIPYAQFPLPFTNIAVRSTMPQSTVASTLRAELGAIDRDFAGNDVRTLDSVLSRNVEQPRFRTLLLGAFAAVALALAAVGVYGLVAYSVTQRTREIGIRLALGARPAQVAGPIIREGLLLATAGVVAGLVVAYALARVLSSFLFGVEARDPLTFVSVAAVLIVVAFAASYVPSRRALRVDPMTALRIE